MNRNWFDTSRMLRAGDYVDEKDPHYNFKGWRKYWNSYTLRGRFNNTMLSYALLAGIILAVKYKPKKADQSKKTE